MVYGRSALRPCDTFMRFPLADRLDLPCVFERLIPGNLHPDGRRYLPLIVLRPTTAPQHTVTPPDLRLGVVDRHHLVAAASAGSAGSSRLLCALSALRLQEPPYRRGFAPEAGWTPGAISTSPVVFGEVLAVAAWEVVRGHLPYEELYTELLLDVGHGTVGLRTSLTARSLAEAIGKERLRAGDWVRLDRSRIDVLGFIAMQVAS